MTKTKNKKEWIIMMPKTERAKKVRARFEAKCDAQKKFFNQAILELIEKYFIKIK